MWSLHLAGSEKKNLRSSLFFRGWVYFFQRLSCHLISELKVTPRPSSLPGQRQAAALGRRECWCQPNTPCLIFPHPSLHARKVSNFFHTSAFFSDSVVSPSHALPLPSPSKVAPYHLPSHQPRQIPCLCSCISINHNPSCALKHPPSLLLSPEHLG